MTSHTLPKDKIPASRYHYAVTLINQLRENFSVKEVSRIAQGHSDMHGWADTALRLRGVVTEHHIKNMEDYLRPKKRMGITPGDHRLTHDQQRAYRKLVLRMREIHGWDNQKIAAALELSDKSQVSKVLANGQGTLSKLQKAQAIVDALDRAAAEDEQKRPGVRDLVDPAFTPPDPEPGSPELANGRREPAEVPKTVVVLGPAPTPARAPTPLEAAITAGLTFLDQLGALEASLPVFAKKAARDLRGPVQAVLDQLTDGGSQ